MDIFVPSATSSSVAFTKAILSPNYLSMPFAHLTCKGNKFRRV